ncbi:MAG: hypothetical protein BEN19_01040 [Epulopiscium sp. Nuni2H_MBin003]|nr:MAG: hypothetical protein BEN19_01040 [Epulopiscium sp. Nuni2H_MBin003]
MQNSFLYGLNATESLQESGILAFHNYPYGELRGAGVILGFLDTGIDYTNDVFRYEDGSSRILSIWDQTVEGDPPLDFDFGTEYVKAQLDAALRSDDPYESVPTKDDYGHGTYIAAIAGGSDRLGRTGFIGAAPNSDIIAVKMQQASESLRELFFLNNNEVAYSDGAILTAINYLVQKATTLNKPLVICIAVGNNYGGHDGTNIIERYLETLTLAPGIIVVGAAGNEANAAHHYKSTILAGEKKTVEINIAENEDGFITYLWTKAVDKISVGIRTPIGQIIERIPLKPYKLEEFMFSLQNSQVTIEYRYPESNTGGEAVAISIKDPIPGIWQIEVYGDYIINGTFDMWLPRIGFIQTNTRFFEPSLETTVCTPATARNVIVVGGYDEIDGSLYVASGRGPTRKGVIKPDFVAPSIAVKGPVINGQSSSYTGTSVGAAITAGASALLLEWSIIKDNLPTVNTRIARDILARGAKRQVGIEYPNNIEGYGRLDFQNSFLII